MNAILEDVQSRTWFKQDYTINTINYTDLYWNSGNVGIGTNNKTFLCNSTDNTLIINGQGFLTDPSYPGYQKVYGVLEPNEIRPSSTILSDTPYVSTAKNIDGLFPNVKGESDVPGITNHATFTYDEAVSILETHGARLPTLEEIMSGVGSTSGQAYDAEYIWTSTSAGHNKKWVCIGGFRNYNNSAQIVNITDPLEKYRTRAFWDISKANLSVHYDDNSRIRTKELRSEHTDGLKLYTQDDTGIFIDNLGNVGIGNTQPVHKLDVIGNTNIIGHLTIEKNYDPNFSGTILNINENTDNDILAINQGIYNIFHIDNGGNVGIGTSLPQYTLDVDGSIRANGNLIVSGTLNVDNISGTELTFETYATIGCAGVGNYNNLIEERFAEFRHKSITNPLDYAFGQWDIGMTIINSAVAQPMHFCEGGFEKMVLKDGKFGIGLGVGVFPSVHLDVIGNTKLTGNLYIIKPDYTFGSIAPVIKIEQNSQDDIIEITQKTNNKTKQILKILNNGYTGIGTAFPVVPLDVNYRAHIGDALIGNRTITNNIFAEFRNKLVEGDNNYAIAQSYAGTTILNTKLGAELMFCEGGASKMSLFDGILNANNISPINGNGLNSSPSLNITGGKDNLLTINSFYDGDDAGPGIMLQRKNAQGIHQSKSSIILLPDIPNTTNDYHLSIQNGLSSENILFEICLDEVFKLTKFNISATTQDFRIISKKGFA